MLLTMAILPIVGYLGMAVSGGIIGILLAFGFYFSRGIHQVILTDAHEYLLNHHQDFDFIWSSPPCQSHSKMIRSGRNRKPRYADLRLYEQILLLTHDFTGLWLVENVVPYYKPLIPAYRAGRHLFWSNFDLGKLQVPEFKGFINRQNMTNKQELMDWLGIYFEENIYYEGNHCPTQILRNCVHPSVGQQIMAALRVAKP